MTSLFLREQRNEETLKAHKTNDNSDSTTSRLKTPTASTSDILRGVSLARPEKPVMMLWKRCTLAAFLTTTCV